MRNDQLQALDVLLGDWDVTLSGAWFLDSLETEQHGTAMFAWLGDAFVVMTSIMEGEPTWDFAFGRTTASSAGGRRRRMRGPRGGRTSTLCSSGAAPERANGLLRRRQQRSHGR
jgi:hypothetical protein